MSPSTVCASPTRSAESHNNEQQTMAGIANRMANLPQSNGDCSITRFAKERLTQFRPQSRTTKKPDDKTGRSLLGQLQNDESRRGTSLLHLAGRNLGDVGYDPVATDDALRFYGLELSSQAARHDEFNRHPTHLPVHVIGPIAGDAGIVLDVAAE